MSGPAPVGAIGQAAAGTDPDARLRQACADLEGVFMAEMLKLMRASVPEGGVIERGAGEQMFAGLVDERLSALAANRLERGLGAALYRSLRAALDAARDGGAAPQSAVP